MSGASCIICGEAIPEGLQVCSRCEGIFSEHKDVLKAMFNKTPVNYDGLNYGCISAFTIRTRVSHIHPMKEPYIVQAELLSRARGCAVWVDPKKIKILERG